MTIRKASVLIALTAIAPPSLRLTHSGNQRSQRSAKWRLALSGSSHGHAPVLPASSRRSGRLRRHSSFQMLTSFFSPGGLIPSHGSTNPSDPTVGHWPRTALRGFGRALPELLAAPVGARPGTRAPSWSKHWEAPSVAQSRMALARARCSARPNQSGRFVIAFAVVF